MYEIASAEEQITLFKLITDKVWQSLADQKKQQDEQAAQQRRQAAMTGSGRAKRGSAKPKPIKPLKPIKPQPLTPPPKPKPIANPQSNNLPNAAPYSTSQATMTSTDAALDDARIALYPQKTGYFTKPIR